MIRFSIITIVRNDPVGVIRTLQSIFSQSYRNYELIVQDGASTDETSDVLRGFGDWIDSLTIEPDGGIYDAMNRALRRATGDYLSFMNAADFFVDDQVLEKVASIIDPEKDDILAGQSVSDETGKVHNYRPKDHYWAGSTCDHQATFIRREIMQQLEYDTRYKISGDLHFFTRAREAGARERHEKIQIARKPFNYGASADFVDRVKDRLGMLEKAYGDLYPVRNVIKRELVNNTETAYKIDRALIEDWSIEKILEERQRWDELL